MRFDNFENIMRMIGSQMSNLRILKMESCGLEDKHIEILSETLLKNPIHILDLSKNLISSKSCKQLERIMVG